MSERPSPESQSPHLPLAERLGMALDNYLHVQEYGAETQYFVHQAAAQDDILHALRSGKREGYVELPTSSGKTYLMTNIAAAAEQTGLRALLLAPTVNIAEQIVGQDEARGLGKFTDLLDNDRVGRQYGGSKADPRDPVVVSTYASFNTFAQTGELGNFDVILADEAHRSLGPVTSNTLRTFNPEAVKLGFTATPYYGIGRSVDEVYGEAIHRLSLREAIESGITAPVQSLIYKTDAEIPLLDPQLKGFSARELNRLLTLKGRNNAVIEFTKNFVETGMRGIVACVPGSNLAHAKFLAQAISEQSVELPDGSSRSIRARSVGAHQTPVENAHVLEQYEAGEIDVLTFVKGLELGWDSQRPRFLINASPTTSPVRMTQLMGRVLRTKEDGSSSIVVDFVDKSQKHQVTSLHVLGEEAIDYRRLVGRADHTGNPLRPVDIRKILHSGLYERIAAAQGRVVNDLYIGERIGDSLQKKFDRQLAREGMPAELPPLVMVPEFALQALEQARQTAFDQTGDDEPTIEDIQREIMILRPRLSENRALEIAREIFAGDTVEDIEDYDLVSHPDLTLEMTLQRLLQDDVEYVLDSLLEREKEVVQRRVMAEEGLQEIADDLGYVSRESIRQITKKALDRLRDPRRAHMLEMYVEDQLDIRTLKNSETRVLLERARQAGTEKAKRFIQDALRDPSSNYTAYTQRYAHGHRKMLERDLKVHIATKDRYLLAATRSKAALTHYKHAAARAKEVTEQLENLRSGKLPSYTIKDIIKIEIANSSWEMQALVTEINRLSPDDPKVPELSRQQAGLLAYHKELLLADHQEGRIHWNDERDTWESHHAS